MPERVLYIKNPGPRPAYYLVADHLWGRGCNVDSDGNSVPANSTEWTELTLSLRDSAESQHLSIDPVSLAPLVLVVRSHDADLCERAAAYIVSCAGGSVDDAV
jgi:hypothetical protein